MPDITGSPITIYGHPAHIDGVPTQILAPDIWFVHLDTAGTIIPVQPVYLQPNGQIIDLAPSPA